MAMTRDMDEKQLHDDRGRKTTTLQEATSRGVGVKNVSRETLDRRAEGSWPAGSSLGGLGEKSSL
jgi:hypothetical protein